MHDVIELQYLYMRTLRIAAQRLDEILNLPPGDFTVAVLIEQSEGLFDLVVQLKRELEAIVVVGAHFDN